MGKVRRSTFVALVLLLLSIAGCKVSCTTANISSLKFSKDTGGTVETKEFARNDTIYAFASVSNNPGNVTLKFRLFTEKVEGRPENAAVPNADVSVDVPGDGRGIYTLTPPPGGWPAGRYRVEVAMLYKDEQKDQETATFTVTGGGSGGAPPGPATVPSPAGDDTPEDNENDSEDSSP